MRNLALILGAVAVLAVSLVLVQGADDDGAETSGATQATTAPAAAATPGASTSSTSTAPAAPAPEPAAPKVPTVVFADGAPRGGVRKLSFDKGDEVRFRVRSDVADEIHVHGFDEYVDVVAGKSVMIAFEARFDGAFEVEMHGSATPIASLVIQP